jgi:hypothetical protein
MTSTLDHTLEMPDTVTEAVAFLTSEGYVEDCRLTDEGLLVTGVDDSHSLETAIVDYAFRFEGPSDPGDEAIVLGVSGTDWSRKAIVVCAYGPYAEPEHAALLTALAHC